MVDLGGPRALVNIGGGLSNANFNRHAQLAGMKIQIRESALAARVCRPEFASLISGYRLETGITRVSESQMIRSEGESRNSRTRVTRVSCRPRSPVRGWKIVSRESRGGNASRLFSLPISRPRISYAYVYIYKLRGTGCMNSFIFSQTYERWSQKLEENWMEIIKIINFVSRLVIGWCKVSEFFIQEGGREKVTNGYRRF